MAKSSSARSLVLGGLAVAAAAAGALKNRSKLAGRFGGAVKPPEPLPAPSEAPVGQASSAPEPLPAPAIANADAAGPPANTATSVPAPEPVVHEPAGAIDEAAEEAAAAAEAANIGGAVSEYPGTELGEAADEEERALIEAGEGEAEGQEIAEFDLQDNVEPAAGDPVEGGRRIDDVIEAQEDPTAGEQSPDDQSAQLSAAGAAPPQADERVADVPDPPAPSTPAPELGDTLAAATVDEGAPTTGGTLSGLGDEPGGSGSAGGAGEAGGDDDGSEWQTWSGRAVDP